jgi:DNA-binding ferritin-like protein
MKINDLVANVFAIRNAAHLAHWATNSYAQHMALDDFYNGVIEKLDTIVEAYQGYFGLIGKVDQITCEPDNIADQIADMAQLIARERSNIANGTPAIENLIDELTETFFKTFYKLCNLR